MAVTKTRIEDFPSTEPVFSIELRNRKGSYARISNYGALLTHYVLHDGVVSTDIVVGFDDVKQYVSREYLEAYAYVGAAIGRYGNRIAEGRFELAGKPYSLVQNNGSNHLHGGAEGFDKKIWTVKDLGEDKNPFLILEYLSPDGEEGYPGNLSVELRFELSDADELCYSYRASTDKTTLVNLTHHSYFNLAGDNSSVADTELEIPASQYIGQDENNASNGSLIPVENSRFDFRKPRPIGPELSPGNDYDFGFKIDAPPNKLRLAARAYSPHSEIELSILTTESVVHLYTAGGLSINDAKSRNYAPYSAFCLETQEIPNGINLEGFPDSILQPGEQYVSKTCYQPKYRN